MRITHEEFGFGEEDLENFLKKGGIKWLPSVLQGSTSFKEGSTESLWTIYLRNTLKRCQAVLLIVHSMILIGSLVRGSALKPFRYLLPFVAIVYIVWLTGFFLLDGHIQNTVWARNIRSKLANQIPETLALALESSRATLPTEDDIMKFDKMKSSYMHSFEHVLEVAHPGNAEFHRIIEHYQTGYSILTGKLQQQLRNDMYEALERRRVLAQTPSSGWAEVSEVDRNLFLHEALLPLTMQRQLLRKVAHLISESQFGYHRSSAIHRFHIPQLLAPIRQKLLLGEKNSDGSFGSSKTGYKAAVAVDNTKPASFKPKGITLVSDVMPATIVDSAGHEPRTHLAVGDAVDAIFGRDFDCKYFYLISIQMSSHQLVADWYRGRIVDAMPYRSKWVVEFEDGDVESNACLDCVVASEPFLAGDTIEIQTGGDEDDVNYEIGQVLTVHSDTTLDINVEGEVVRRVPISSLRRPAFEVRSVVVGDRVHALYPEAGSVWYAGTIAHINEEGTVAINYDDGDYLEDVPMTDIRISDGSNAERD